MSNLLQVVPKVHDANLHEDDRGSVYCPFDNMQIHKIKRTYIVRNWSRGMVRAWHGHRDARTFMHVIKGAAKIVAKPIESLGENVAQDLVAVLSDRQPKIFEIPPMYYNGAMSLEDDTRILVYSTLSFLEVRFDDVRAEVTEEDYQKYWRIANR